MSNKKIVKSELVLNEDDKFELVPEGEKLKKEEEGVELIQNVANEVYNIPQHDAELNLFKQIVFSIGDEAERKEFVDFFREVDNTLLNRNDVVQRMTISSVLYNKLFLYKHKNSKFNIHRALAGINYKKDNGTWLKEMVDYTVPFLVNNNLLKEFRNV